MESVPTTKEQQKLIQGPEPLKQLVALEADDLNNLKCAIGQRFCDAMKDYSVDRNGKRTPTCDPSVIARCGEYQGA